MRGQPLEAFDKKKLKKFFAQQSLDTLVDQSVVLFVGPTRVGKSTAIGVQLGAIYERNSAQLRGYTMVDSNGFTPKTSDGFTSLTLHISPYVDEENGLTYLDTAGLGETRGKEESLWTLDSLNTLFSAVREIKAVVIMFDFTTAFGGSAAEFRKLAKSLDELSRGEEAFFNSIIFLVTNPYVGGAEIGKGDLLREATRMHNELAAELREFKNSLAERYPLDRVQRAGQMVSRLRGQEEEKAVTFDVNRLSEQDREQLKSFSATLKLLGIMTSPSDRVVFSIPDGRAKCRAIRRELLNKIKSTPSVVKRDLDRIKHVTHDQLLLQSLVGSLANDWFSMVSQEANSLTELVNQVQSKSEDLDAIERNWEVFKRSLITSKEAVMRTLSFDISRDTEEKNRLERSTVLCVLPDTTPPVQKDFSYGFLGFRYWWRQTAKATYDYEYQGHEPFVEYGTSKEEHFDTEVIEERKAEGVLKLRFTSHNGYGLNFRVNIYVHEKNLPATRERIATLTQRIHETTERKQAVEDDIRRLNTIGSKEELRREFNREFSELEGRIRATRDSMGRLIYQTEPFREWDAVCGVSNYIQLLTNLNALHRDLTPVTRRTLDDFIGHYRTVIAKLQNTYIRGTLLPELIDDHERKEHSDHHREPPRRTGLSAAAAFGYKVSRKAADYFPTVSTFLGTYKLEFGVALVALAASITFERFGLDREVRFSASSNLATTCFVSASFVICHYVRGLLEKMAANVTKVTEANKAVFMGRLKELLDEIELEAKKASVTARDLSIFAAEKAARKFENFNLTAHTLLGDFKLG